MQALFKKKLKILNKCKFNSVLLVHIFSITLMFYLKKVISIHFLTPLVVLFNRYILISSLAFIFTFEDVFGRILVYYYKVDCGDMLMFVSRITRLEFRRRFLA